MGRGRRKPKFEPPKLDATEERLRHAEEEAGCRVDAWDFIDPSRIDSHKTIGLVRRFKATHLDRLYRREDPERSRLTFRQWYAGDWYRSTHARSGFTISVIACYGERTSFGEPTYGMPRNEAQLQARELWRAGRRNFPAQMVGFMDRLLIHDELPRYRGRARMRSVEEIAYALDCLADWLKLAREPKTA